MNTYSTRGFFISSAFHTALLFLLFYTFTDNVIKKDTFLQSSVIALRSFELPQKDEIVTSPIKEKVDKPIVKNIEKTKTVEKKEATIAKPIENKSIVAETKQDIITKEVADLKQEIAPQEALIAKEDVNKLIAQEILPTAQTPKSQEEEMQEFTKTNFKSIRDRVLLNLQYPHIARRMGQSGIVKIVLVIDTNGKLLDVVLEKSSGHKILDSCAIDAAKRLFDQELPIPKTIARVTLPINFALN